MSVYSLSIAYLEEVESPFSLSCHFFRSTKRPNTKTVIILLVIAALIAIVPLFALKGAEFGGSDDAGSEMISEIQGKEYEPWFTPVLETALGGELPGEIESLIFCLCIFCHFLSS